MATLKMKFLFGNPLETTTAGDVFDTVGSFLKEWKRRSLGKKVCGVCVCTDGGAHVTLGCRFGF